MDLKHSVLLAHADGVHLFHADPMTMRAINGAPLVLRMNEQQKQNAAAQIRAQKSSESVCIDLPRYKYHGQTRAVRAHAQRIDENWDEFVDIRENQVKVVDSGTYVTQVTNDE